MRGMSGAPVLAGELVAGMVSARYNSIDGWGRDSVWVARTEDLVPLLAGLGDVEMTRRGWAGTVELVLSVGVTTVGLHGAGREVSGPHRGISSALAEALRGLRAGRARLTGLRTQDLADALPPAVQATPAAVGRLLAESFLPEVVAAALGEVVAGAQARWIPVRLGIEVHGTLQGQGLPWEALPVPGTQTPLALHPLLVVYRRPPATRPALVSSLPGPLRIVIAISAPLSGGGAVLDYERELRNVLAAVRAARQDDARIQIVHFATTSEIRAALEAAPAHVLHLSGHGAPGVIELEDDDGNARVLDAVQFAAEAIPPGRMPPVIALASCYGDAATASGDQSFAAALTGLGAAAVIGTETAVTDIYATRVFARVYGALADSGEPEIVAAVAQARRIVQQQLSDSGDRREQQLAQLGEWAVLTVLSAAGPMTVIDASAAGTSGAVAAVPAGPRLPAGLLARQTGEFVGRRRAQRRWPAELLAPGAAGLVLHGIGGVGKTTLAAELVRRISERDPDRLAVIASSGLAGGKASVDNVLTALADALRRRSRGTRPDFDHATSIADRADVDWQHRLAALREDILETLPVLLVLDNFEDNLTTASPPGQPGWRTLADQDLAALLAQLATLPGRCRLLITSRYPFVLPGQAERALAFQPIGPLTAAETMKLAWALPALDKLTEAELDHVWQMVGGHPRCLEYVDALLSGGHGSYPDVTARLAARLTARLNITDLDTWFAEHDTLDTALAETLTQAADEVLLDRLLAGLATVPGTEELLLGISVYRAPADHAGLLFQVGIPDPDAAADPAAAAREQITAILTAAGIPLGRPIDPGELPASLHQQLRPYLADLGRQPTPAFRAPPGLRRLVEACTASSLLATDTSQDPPALFVHRWTASELQKRWTRDGRGDQLTAAHLGAAQYWQWRVQAWPQDRSHDLDNLIEACHHLFAAGHTTEADELTWAVCNVLHDWGAWDREDALIRDTLTQVPADADGRSNWTRQLADIAHGRGRITQATQLYQQALAIDQQQAQLDPANTGFQRDLSVSYSRLADLAGGGGDTAEAARLHHQVLAIRERLAQLDPANTGFQRDLAVTYQRLADLAGDGGDTAEAARLHHQALAIIERLAQLDPANTGFQRNLAVTYQRLADLAGDGGDTAEAARLQHQALAIIERLAQLDPANTGFQRDLSVSYSRLADLAGDGGDTAEAARLHHQVLAIRVRLAQLDPANTGFQRDLSVTYERLADLAGGGGDTAEAARLHHQVLAIRERLAQLDPANTGFQRNLAVTYQRLADLAGGGGDTAEAARLQHQALAIIERLAQLDPANTGFQRDLAVTYERLADLAGGGGDTAEAARLQHQVLAIRERLAQLDPANTGFQRDLSVTYERLADLAGGGGDTAEAARLHHQVLAIRERLAQLDPANTGFQRDLAVTYGKLADLAAASEDPGNAALIFRQALDFCERLYGTDHSLTQAFRDRAREHGKGMDG